MSTGHFDLNSRAHADRDYRFFKDDLGLLCHQVLKASVHSGSAV